MLSGLCEGTRTRSRTQAPIPSSKRGQRPITMNEGRYALASSRAATGVPFMDGPVMALRVFSPIEATAISATSKGRLKLARIALMPQKAV